jgi:hypothetical protein
MPSLLLTVSGFLLPVVQSIKVELIVSRKALGLTVPMWLLGRADEMVE